MKEKHIKLSPKKDGRGSVTSFTINIGINEARECGFINSNNEILSISKIIDTENNQIIIKLSKG